MCAPSGSKSRMALLLHGTLLEICGLVPEMSKYCGVILYTYAMKLLRNFSPYGYIVSTF